MPRPCWSQFRPRLKTRIERHGITTYGVEEDPEILYINLRIRRRRRFDPSEDIYHLVNTVVEADDPQHYAVRCLKARAVRRTISSVLSTKKPSTAKEGQNRLREESWNEFFDQLVVFKCATGHCYPTNAKGGSSLVNWANRQRRINQENKLPPDRKEKLESIGFAFNFTFNRKRGPKSIARGKVE